MRFLKPPLSFWLSDPKIDWGGHVPFKPDGSVNTSDPRYYEIYVPYGVKPVPVVARDSPEYQKLVQAERVLNEMMTPARDEEILFELKKLSLFYPVSDRAIVDFKLMLGDYVFDLKGYPLNLIREACRIYRNDPDRMCDYFPRPGKLKSIVHEKFHAQQYMLTKIRALINNSKELT